MVLVGRQAPDFTSSAVLGDGSMVEFKLHEFIHNKYAVLFFYPMDFTFVCPSELIELDRALPSFKARDTEVIGISIDSQFVHNAWRNTPLEKGGIGPVQFPLVADVKHQICQSYGIEHPHAGVAFRGTFVVDPKGTVRSQLVYDLPIGRNIEEIVRLVDAVQFTDKYGEVCPANWKKGKAGMNPSAAGVAKYLAEHIERQ